MTATTGNQRRLTRKNDILPFSTQPFLLQRRI